MSVAIDPDLMEELFREKPRPQPNLDDGAANMDDSGRRTAPGSSRLRSESLARLLDAAVLVVHAVGNLTTVAEEVLAEQRDRLRSQPASVSADEMPTRDPSPSWRAEHIDLSY